MCDTLYKELHIVQSTRLEIFGLRTFQPLVDAERGNMSSAKKVRKLSDLDKKCFMKYFLHELKSFQENSNAYVKSLGIEAAYETVLMLAQDEPLFIKVVASDEDNFTVLLDENCAGDYSPIFVIKDGIVDLSSQCECNNDCDDDDGEKSF